jgi:hypothetical protein
MRTFHRPVEGQTIVAHIVCPTGDLHTGSGFVLRLTGPGITGHVDLQADASNITEHTADLTHSVSVEAKTCQELGTYVMIAIATLADRVHKLAKNPARFGIVEDDQPTSQF